MKINGEEVEPVQSFDELKPGIVLWLYPCQCGKNHRCIVLGGGCCARSVAVLPEPSCKPDWWDGPATLHWEDTGNRNTFRVVDGLPDKTADAMGAISDRAAARAMAAIRERQRIERLLRRNGIG